MNKKFTIFYWALFLLSIIHSNAQPVFLKVLNPNSRNFISTNGNLYFTTGDSLWKSNGTPAGTVFVKEIGEPIDRVTELTVGTFFYFTTHEAGGNTALWKSNGTAVNTFKVFSAPVINPLITFHSALFLGIDDGVHGYELWRATAANVFTLVRDINVGSGSGLGDEILIFNDKLIFKANSGSGGTNLWSSNGTSVTNLAVNLPFDSYYALTEVNTFIFFARTYTSGDTVFAEIWKTNATPAGTSLVKQFFEPDGIFCNMSASNLIKYNNKLYFDLITGCGIAIDNLYSSDGSAIGTVFIKTVNLDGYITPFLKVNNRLVFHNSSQGFPGSIIRSNGTAAGTESFYNLNSEPTRPFERVGNLLFFADHTESNFGSIPPDPDDYYQLYQSGLHTENTETLQDIFGTSFAGANNLTDANGKLFFTTYNDHPSVPPASRVMRLYYYDPTVVFKLASTQPNIETELNAYPNPSQENFNFSVTSKTSATATADIYRSDGVLVKRVLETNASEGQTIEFNWNGTDLPGGVYICKYTCGSELVVKKIVLKK